MIPSSSQRIGIYNILHRIGAGSFGEVFLASADGSDEAVVLKVVPLFGADVEARETALREVQVMKSVFHPFVVRFIEAFLHSSSDAVVAQSGDQPFADLVIVLSFCDSGDLSSAIRTSAQHSAAPSGEELWHKMCLTWTAQLFLALLHLHSSHILHRDIKPSNLFLRSSQLPVEASRVPTVLNSDHPPSLVVGDFGVARVLTHSTDLATTAVGTPLYMPPELFQGASYGSTCDVWSAGCCVFEMISRSPPFVAKDLPGLVARVCGAVCPSLPSTAPRWAIAVVARCLTPDPSNRATVCEVLREPTVAAAAAAALRSVNADRAIVAQFSAAVAAKPSFSPHPTPKRMRTRACTVGSLVLSERQQRVCRRGNPPTRGGTPPPSIPKRSVPGGRRSTVPSVRRVSPSDAAQLGLQVVGRGLGLTGPSSKDSSSPSGLEGPRSQPRSRPLGGPRSSVKTSSRRQRSALRSRRVRARSESADDGSDGSGTIVCAEVLDREICVEGGTVVPSTGGVGGAMGGFPMSGTASPSGVCSQAVDGCGVSDGPSALEAGTSVSLLFPPIDSGPFALPLDVSDEHGDVLCSMLPFGSPRPSPPARSRWGQPWSVLSEGGERPECSLVECDEVTCDVSPIASEKQLGQHPSEGTRSNADGTPLGAPLWGPATVIPFALRESSSPEYAGGVAAPPVNLLHIPPYGRSRGSVYRHRRKSLRSVWQLGSDAYASQLTVDGVEGGPALGRSALGGSALGGSALGGSALGGSALALPSDGGATPKGLPRRPFDVLSPNCSEEKVGVPNRKSSVRESSAIRWMGALAYDVSSAPGGGCGDTLVQGYC